ncbi:MAG: hypothetical protein RIS92_1168 [Verrucomicrobiota bacterium]|jgi:hypothetical protein
MKTTKTTSMVTKSALALAACASLNALAGDAKPAAAAAPASEGILGPVTATLDTGFDTRYYFRGLWFADNIAWSALNVTVPLADKLTLVVGGSYTKGMDTPYIGGQLEYQEADYWTSLNYDAGVAKFGLVYTQYGFPREFSGLVGSTPQGVTNELRVLNAQELGATASTTIGPVNIAAGAYYDFKIGATYTQVGVDTSIEVTSNVSLVPAVTAGYSIGDYYTQNGAQGGFTHVIPSVSTPIKLSKNATLTPYAAYNISGTQRQSNVTDSELFGGLKLSLSF